MVLSSDPVQRFLSKLKESPRGCWIFQGYLDKHGYGSFMEKSLRQGGRIVRAHRFSYELFYRETIPEGLVIDHLCRTPACVNPWHLEVVTVRQNTLRSHLTQASKQLLRTHCPRGHEYNKQNTRLAGRRRFCRLCAAFHTKNYLDRKRKR